MKDRIAEILKFLHLYAIVRAVYRKLKPIGYFFSDIVRRIRFRRDFRQFFAQAKAADIAPGGILAFGILCTNHKPTLIPFMTKLQQAAGRNIIFLDEARASDIVSPFPLFHVPRSAPVKFDRYLELPVTGEMEQLIQEKPYLQHAVENMTLRLKNIKTSYAKVLVCKSYELYQYVLDTWKPSEVMLWNEFNALHAVFTEVCREKGIDPIFLEFGVLPGTFAIEHGGQMGKSMVARNAEEFLQKPVAQEDLEKSREVLSFLRASGLNRNVQPDNNEMELLLEKMKADRPIVLFAGQHDFDSGLIPYTEETRQYHSPMFATSLDAANHLAKIAEANDWNFIFKPHPGVAGRYKKTDFADNVIFVNRINLNELIDKVDVVITLMSQTAYVSLIREKAVVTLGYNQLRGKGCTYEAYTEDAIEQAIAEAIAHGCTPEQKQQFVRHCAQLLKYYLYDNLADRPIRYGQTLGDPS